MGAQEGVAFYLLPNPENIRKAGLGNVIYGALNQSFFTLSLGMGGMEIFGSYIGRERSLAGEAIVVAGLDTFVAIVAGLIVIPACFTYGIEPGAENYERIAAGNIVPTLSKAFEIESIRAEGVDLQSCAEAYLERIGMSRDEIEMLKSKLGEDYGGLS